jgi:hypothetical protein
MRRRAEIARSSCEVLRIHWSPIHGAFGAGSPDIPGVTIDRPPTATIESAILPPACARHCIGFSNKSIDARQQNMKRIGFWHGLLAVSLSALLAGCGWFGGNDVAPAAKARPGADRQIAPTGTLPPPPPGHAVEQGVAPVDEAAPQVGSVVGAKGGQRAQKEAAEKETADRDAKERAQRDEAEREAKARQQSVPSRTTPAAASPVDGPASPEPLPAAPKS